MAHPPYKGVSVPDALKEHAGALAEILSATRAFLKEQNDPAYDMVAAELPLDEITVLKYLLSALKKKEKAVATAISRLQETFDFRKTYADVIARAKNTTELGGFVPWRLGGFLGDELVAYSEYGQADFNEIKERFGTTEACFAESVVQTEQIRLLTDKRTRETGRICKLLHIINLTGISMSKTSNMTVIKALGKVSATNESTYPQILGRAIVMYPPYIFRVLMNLARPFLSKSTLDKIIVCGARSSQTDCAECPFVKKYIAAHPEALKCIPKLAGGRIEGKTTLEI